jgi:rfaE bifunctional protein nucleotidyltransferase chain/domain
MKTNRLQPAIFLDRDGTINLNTHYVNKPSQVSLLPNAADGLKILKSLGFLLVGVTNQSGIARGYFTLSDLKKVNDRLQQLLGRSGVALDAIYFSPFHKKGTIKRFTKDSDCRKPGPGMLRQAAKDLGIDLSSSYMIGDMDSDIGAGINAGVRATVFLGDAGKKLEYNPTIRAKNLIEAAVWIGIDMQRAKIAESKSELEGKVRRLRQRCKKIVFTNGAFDILHPGHVNFLRFARSLGDALVVGLNSDSSIRKYKGKDRPVNPEPDRLAMLCGLDSVDLVTVFSETDPRAVIRVVKPDIHVKDGNYLMQDLLEARTVVDNGGRVVLIPRIGDYSSTRVIKKLRQS